MRNKKQSKLGELLKFDQYVLAHGSAPGDSAMNMIQLRLFEDNSRFQCLVGVDEVGAVAWLVLLWLRRSAMTSITSPTFNEKFYRP